jgi:predicted RNA-binding Zn-ribbon protein involved in translation (DUF1610 family)
MTDLASPDSTPANVPESGPSIMADAERPRTFPCEGCGASLTFDISVQSLKCPFCGYVKSLEVDPQAAVQEQDFAAALARIAERRGEAAEPEPELREVRCASCGGTAQFQGTLTSRTCPYCGVAVQLEHVHEATRRIPVDGVLPFLIEQAQARQNLDAWVRSRWFAPNAFTAHGVEGRFNGVYLPFWTFDSLTATHYTGQRGEHYWVTVGSGKNRRQERRTRWYPVSGSFRRFFDDVLVVAATAVPTERLAALEPWPLERCLPYNAQVLAGFLARTYDVPLESGFTVARQIIAEALEADVRGRIGGDEQRITSIDTSHQAVTYKHLLLPVWMLAYRYRDKSYQVVVNAGTGEVQGDRPYSWIKIALTAVAAAVAAAVAVYLVSQS